MFSLRQQSSAKTMVWQHDNFSVEKANVAVGQQKQKVVVVATKRICRRCKSLAEKSCVVVSIKMASDKPRGNQRILLPSSRATSHPRVARTQGVSVRSLVNFFYVYSPVASNLFQRCARVVLHCWPSLLGILKQGLLLCSSKCMPYASQSTQ